jgi:NADH dehydrogenase [ubiquinone] 1 alpha subcomplex assembly factor 1
MWILNMKISAGPFIVSLLFAATASLNVSAKGLEMIKPVQLNFINPDHFSRLFLVHDTVMGGHSQGDVFKSADGNAVLFAGNLSLENNGGFASVEFRLQQKLPAETFTQVSLNATADNRTYQLRLKTPYIPQGVAYVAEFKAENSNNTYRFDVAAFAGRYRGRTVTNLPELNLADVNQISVMLADKIPGTFQIELHTLRFTAE